MRNYGLHSPRSMRSIQKASWSSRLKFTSRFLNHYKKCLDLATWLVAVAILLLFLTGSSVAASGLTQKKTTSSCSTQPQPCTQRAAAGPLKASTKSSASSSSLLTSRSGKQPQDASKTLSVNWCVLFILPCVKTPL